MLSLGVLAMTVLADGTPSPSQTPAVPDPSITTPGAGGFFVAIFLALAVVGLAFAMSRQLRRVDVNEAERVAREGGVTGAAGTATGTFEDERPEGRRDDGDERGGPAGRRRRPGR